MAWSGPRRISNDGFPIGKWLPFDPCVPCLLPRFPAVYAVLFDGVVVYVGQSSDIRERFSRHSIKAGYGMVYRTPWGEVPHSVDITAKMKLSRRYGDWAMWELRLIRRLRPRLNGTFVNLRRHVA